MARKTTVSKTVEATIPEEPYDLTFPSMQNFVGPICAPCKANGRVSADPSTPNHKNENDHCIYRSEPNTARTLKRKRKDDAGIAIE